MEVSHTTSSSDGGRLYGFTTTPGFLGMSNMVVSQPIYSRFVLQLIGTFFSDLLLGFSRAGPVSLGVKDGDEVGCESLTTDGLIGQWVECCC